MQIGCIHLVSKCSAIDFTQSRHRELVWSQAEADVRVGELGGQSVAGVPNNSAVVERHLRQLRHGVPRSVGRKLRVRAQGNQSQEGRRDAAPTRNALRIAENGQLFEMCDLTQIDLVGEESASRRGEVLVVTQGAAGQ